MTFCPKTSKSREISVFGKIMGYLWRKTEEKNFFYNLRLDKQLFKGYFI